MFRESRDCDADGAEVSPPVLVQSLCDSVERFLDRRNQQRYDIEHAPDQVIRKLAEGNKLHASVQELEGVCRHLEIAESTSIAGLPKTAS